MDSWLIKGAWLTPLSGTIVLTLSVSAANLLAYILGLFFTDNLYVISSLIHDKSSLQNGCVLPLCVYPVRYSRTRSLRQLLTFMSFNSVLIFIITILLLAADFYYLKNIAGRRLVGLRWWNEVDPTSGDSKWVFESFEPGTKQVNATDSRFFWMALYVHPLVWAVFAVVALVRFKFIWLSLVGRSLFHCIGISFEHAYVDALYQPLRYPSQSRTRWPSQGVISSATLRTWLGVHCCLVVLRETWRVV